MEWKFPHSHRIFDHLILEGLFRAVLPTPRGWKGLPSGECWRDHSLLFVQKDVLNHKAEQLQAVDLCRDHPGARLKGHLVPQLSWQTKGALT